MNGDKFIYGSLIIGLCLLAISLAGKGIKYAWERRDGTCICNIPQRVIGFRMSPDGDGSGCFRGTTMFYKLGYEGAYNVSGDICTEWLTVSEEEYYRKLNGR